MKLQEAIDFAKSRESQREMDFSDQERIFGTLLGSVPNKVSHHAPCSVLIIRTT